MTSYQAGLLRRFAISLICSLTVFCWSGNASGKWLTLPVEANENSPPAGKHSALLIGVSRYDDPKFAELPGAEPDAIDLAAVLAANGYPKENTVTMTHRNGTEDPRLLPTSSNIRKQLKKFAKDKNPQDRVIVALAGHGLQTTSQEYFFCPADANLTETKTLISIPEIYELLNECEAEFKLLLVDACRENIVAEGSSNSTSSTNNDNPLNTSASQNLPNPPPGLAAFFSCSNGQLAYERKDGRKVNGVFFHSVIRGLAGAAAGSDGLVTLPDLERFVKKDVESYVLKTYSASQHPVIRNNTVGLIPLLVHSASDKKVKQAFELWLRSRRKEATEIIDGLLAERPDDPIALAEKSRLICEQVESTGDKRQSEEMLELASRSVRLAAHRIEPHLALANVQRVRQQYSEALEECNRALAIDPKCAMAYMYRAVVFCETEQNDRMERDMNTIRELDDRQPLIESILAGLLFRLDEFNEAFARLDEAIERTPDIPLLQFMKGYGYDQLGNYDKAILAYTAALRLDGQDDEILARRATSLSRAGDYLGAMDDLKAIERINPQRSDLADLRAFVLNRDRFPAPRSTVAKNSSKGDGKSKESTSDRDKLTSTSTAAISNSKPASTATTTNSTHSTNSQVIASPTRE
ncbi:MAG: caspase family protein [Pirellulales bacterium]